MEYRGYVLIVDDDIAIQLLLHKRLAAEAFYCVAVGDGDQALAEARSHHFDVVLLDIGLPGMSGLEVLRELRATQPAACVVMVSGMDDLATAVEAMKLEAHDYLPKPFDLADLVERVNKALQRHHHLLKRLDRERDMELIIRQQRNDMRELVSQTVSSLATQHVLERQLDEAGGRKWHKIDPKELMTNVLGPRRNTTD